jgi:hypothetical protein
MFRHIVIVPGAEARPCRPCSALMALEDAGELPRFTATWGKSKGDCAYICEALAREVGVLDRCHGGSRMIAISSIGGLAQLEPPLRQTIKSPLTYVNLTDARCVVFLRRAN